MDKKQDQQDELDTTKSMIETMTWLILDNKLSLLNLAKESYESGNNDEVVDSVIRDIVLHKSFVSVILCEISTIDLTYLLGITIGITTAYFLNNDSIIQYLTFACLYYILFILYNLVKFRKVFKVVYKRVDLISYPIGITLGLTTACFLNNDPITQYLNFAGVYYVLFILYNLVKYRKSFIYLYQAKVNIKNKSEIKA